MTTRIEDNQLNAELQELYLMSKHWSSDLEFFVRELTFLQDVLKKAYTKHNDDNESAKIPGMILEVSRIQNQCLDLRNEVGSYISVLQPLLNNSRQNYHLGLIETHAALQRGTSSLLQSFKTIKKAVFELFGKSIKLQM